MKRNYFLVIIQRPQVTLAILAILFFVPPILAIWSYSHHGLWQRGSSNQGQLIAVPPNIDHFVKPNLAMKGRWNLWVAAPSSCDLSCKSAIQTIIKVRQALGKERMRINLLVSASSPTDVAALQSYAKEQQTELTIVPMQANAYDAFAKRNERTSSIYIVDPIGNVILSFRSDKPEAIFHDLRHLLNVSRIG